MQIEKSKPGKLSSATKASKKSGKEPKKKKESPHELLKLKVTQELGLLDKVKSVGWGGLSAAESDRVGGIMTRILKEQKKRAHHTATDK